MPFVFAIGIAVLAFCGQVLVSAQSIILWERSEESPQSRLIFEKRGFENFIKTSLPFLLCSLLTYHAPESPRWLLACSQRERAAQVFNHLAKMNGQVDHQEPVLKPSQVRKDSVFVITIFSLVRKLQFSSCSNLTCDFDWLQ